MLLKALKEIEKRIGKKKLSATMEMTTQDIKFNRVGFNKKTSPKTFLRILLYSLNVVEKINA